MNKFIATVVGVITFEDDVVFDVIAVVVLSKAFVVKEVSTLSDVEDVEAKIIDLYSSSCPTVVMVTVLFVVIGEFDLSDVVIEVVAVRGITVVVPA